MYAYDLDTGDRPGRQRHQLGQPGLVFCFTTDLWSDGTTMWVLYDTGRKAYAYDLDTGDRQADKDFEGLAAEGRGWLTGIWSNAATMWVADWGTVLHHDQKGFCLSDARQSAAPVPQSHRR